MLCRIVFVSETVGAAGRSKQSLAEILGAAEGNNRRDEISAAMLFHDGQVVQMIEGDRADLDRLMRRLSTDGRLANLRVLEDRPIMQRRLSEPMRLCRLTETQVGALLKDRPLSALETPRLERLLSSDDLGAFAA